MRTEATYEKIRYTGKYPRTSDSPPAVGGFGRNTFSINTYLLIQQYIYLFTLYIYIADQKATACI